MLKTSLAVLVTAAVCFGIAAATGLASSDRSARTINLKVGPQARPAVCTTDENSAVLGVVYKRPGAY